MTWVRMLDKHVTALDSVMTSSCRGHDRQVRELGLKLEALEQKIENITGTFVNLVKRINVLIDLQKETKK
jgi:hypothetical protein